MIGTVVRSEIVRFKLNRPLNRCKTRFFFWKLYPAGFKTLLSRSGAGAGDSPDQLQTQPPGPERHLYPFSTCMSEVLNIFKIGGGIIDDPDQLRFIVGIGYAYHHGSKTGVPDGR